MKQNWVLFFLLFCQPDPCRANLPPFFTSDLRPPLIKEDTPVLTPIFKLEGKDPEGTPLKYGLLGSDNLKVDPQTGVVTVIKALDREDKDTLRIVVTIEDVVSTGQNNVVRIPLELVVLDANDNAPVFSRDSFEITIPEDSKIGSTVLGGILLSDVDQVGEVLTIACLDNGKPSEDFAIMAEQMTSRSFRGSLVLKKELPYVARNEFRLALVASDGENMVTAPLTVTISDVQNKPPRFRGSTTGIVAEDASIGSLVMTLAARDGDLGDPRKVMYQLVENPLGFFLLDPESGELRTAKPLDREAVPDPAGVVHLTVKAYEVINGSPANADPTSTSTQRIRVTIRDVNDEPPSFDRSEYRVFIPENLPPGTPIPDLDMVVTDTDVGSNSVFSLRLADSSGRFSASPEGGRGSTSVSLRIAIGGLDYENPNERKFLLLVVAEESLTAQRLSSTATVIVTVTDTNDNSPVFGQEAYTAMVSETASGGTVVTSFGATDADTGLFGTEGIRYSLFGNGAERFMVDPLSGVITVSPCDSPGTSNCLDFETRPTYFLSLKATDEDGAGRTADVPLRINLQDMNDNPPRFSRSAYRAVIQEGATDFEPSLVVEAVDPDITSQVRYTLVGGNPKALFEIDEATGRVTVSDPAGLDISELKMTEIVLTVEASDGTGSHSANVRVSVHDVNNNAPVFSENLYEAAVQENAHIGTLVDVVMATDDDTGVNAAISYRIMRGGYDNFEINSVSGEIMVKRKLNFDERDFYDVEIVAEDGGNPRLQSTSKLQIRIIDNNDKNPYFVPTTQRVKVKEDTLPGSIIHSLSATDLDVTSMTPGQGQGLHFDLSLIASAVNDQGLALSQGEAQALKPLFAVSSTGQVTLNDQLNRNVTAEITLAVTVTDITADPPQTGTGYLVITVVDVNDNAPTFPEPWTPEKPLITVTVTEELPLGSVVTTVTASDVDSNIGRYEFQEPSGVLRIDDVTGVVTVKGRLDYEVTETVRVVVVVTDTGVPQLSASATLVVNLENINDEEPKFSQEIYFGEILEHSGSAAEVLQVSAQDRDKDHLGTITYSLAGDHSQYFTIDSSGRISVSADADLDREKLARMRIRAVATDSGPQDTRRETSVPVHIRILDINDHSPEFLQKVFSASVVENLPLRPPVPVLQVKARDPDDGLNAVLAYKVTGGTGKDLFRLDPSTGILYPSRRLLAPEKPETFDLDVEVRDRNGTGPTPDVARVLITVVPRNEHKPVFVMPPYPAYKVYVPEESTEPELLVLTVSATDQDMGENGHVRFHLRVHDENVQETETFIIGARSGELRTKRILDRETVDKYELVLVAKDNGSPISFETLRVVTVFVKDIDDHAPSFPYGGVGVPSRRTYTFRVRENLAKDNFVGQAQAQDIDLGDHARIFYYIQSGNIDSSFYVDKSNGNIFTNRPLDREARRGFELRIKASNDPNLSFNLGEGEGEGDGEGEREIDESVALVSITVQDENDTPPKFLQEVFYAGVPYNADVSQLVGLVTAVDADEGKNGTLSYAIRSSTFFRPGESKAVGSIVPSPFNITTGGKLLTATLMAPYRRHRFLLEIQAKEVAPPHRVDTCTVNIWVWERSDLIKVILEERPDRVLQRQTIITDELSSVLEGKAVVDEIRYYTHPNNSVSREWTEMLMHVVNGSAHIIPTSDVLMRVDRGFTALRKAQSTSKIKTISPAQHSETKAEIDARLAGLIALLIALFVGTISFVAVCCCLRFWVMTPAKSREHLIHRTIDDDLGLNTTENPLWVDQKLKTYEEQELSMQVMSEFDPAGVKVNNASLHHLETQSNTYATIQKSHGGTLRSLQLRSLQAGDPIPDAQYPHTQTGIKGTAGSTPGTQGTTGSTGTHGTAGYTPRGTLNLGADPGESNDYATLDHLRRSNGLGMGRQGPKVPGVETPLSAVLGQEREHELVTSFTGSTFQAPDSSNMANRPLPEEPLEARRTQRGETDDNFNNNSNDNFNDNFKRGDADDNLDDVRAPIVGGALTLNALGEPCLVAELI